MMIWTMVLFAVAANVDNLVVSAAYRLQGVAIEWRANGVISLVSGCCTGVAMLAAKRAVLWWASEAVSVSLGAGLLIGAGLWFILSGQKRRIRRSYYRLYNRCSLRGQNRQRELVVLAFLLSANNLASGIGAGMTGVSPIGTAILVSLGSMLSIAIGQRVAEKPWIKRWEGYMPWMAGGLLIALGIYEAGSYWLTGGI